MLKRFHTEGIVEAGCDEAGRGCLAGPVFAAAVILPPDFKIYKLNDSKQIAEKERYKLREKIEKRVLAWAVAKVDHEEIDEINILNASFLAMHRAIAQLKVLPGALLIDGNRFNKYHTPTGKNIPHHCIIEGDALYMAIAAASILAKTYRDDFMKELHKEYPNYHWDRNKGYATELHRNSILNFGITPYHRKSFNLLTTQYELEFE